MPITVAAPSPFSVAQTVEFLVDPSPDVAASWGSLSLDPGDTVSLLSETGTVQSVERRDGSVRVTVAWTAVPHGSVVLSVNPRPEGRSRIRVQEDVAPSDARQKAWRAGLLELQRCLDAAHRRRRAYRQAVVVVHGIGEQRVGQPLRSFVEAVFSQGAPKRYLRPDPFSPLIGAEMVSVPGDWQQARPTTDVYEMSWAHLVQKTSPGAVYAWALRLIFSPRRLITRRLLPQVWGARLLVIAGLVVLAWKLLPVPDSHEPPTALTSVAAISFLSPLLVALAKFLGPSLNRSIVGNVLGDAARYFDPSPDNVTTRQSVLEAGATLLEALHDSARYDRIIVYGHSLGSVIAYDVTAYAWAVRSRAWKVTEPRRTPRLRAVEDLVNLPASEVIAVETAAQAQHAAWRELNANGFGWLVSDLVTAGSPLTHAPWLIRPPGGISIEQAMADRAMPRCPPWTEPVRTPDPTRMRNRFTYLRSGPAERRWISALVPHHAAPFAVTRWTNLYFPLRGPCAGDPVGGPLTDIFGGWISDRPIRRPRGLFLGFAHTAYLRHARGRFARGSGDDARPVDDVRAALRLPMSLSVADWHEMACDYERTQSARAAAKVEGGP